MYVSLQYDNNNNNNNSNSNSNSNTHSTCNTIDMSSKSSVTKVLKILNAADNYTVAREAHRMSNIRLAAIDSGASGNYYPSDYKGKNHNPLAHKVTVGCANDTGIKLKARNTI